MTIWPETTEEELDVLRRAWADWAELTPEEIIDQLDDDVVRVMALNRYMQVNAFVVSGALVLRDDRDEHARESEWNVRPDP